MKRLHDTSLNVFRDGVAQLRQAGEARGHVATSVEHFWSFGRPLTMQERVFLKITWADGRPVEVMEDYPTWKNDKEVWTVVDELRSGVLVPTTHDAEYTITWLEGTSTRKLGCSMGRGTTIRCRCSPAHCAVRAAQPDAG